MALAFNQLDEKQQDIKYRERELERELTTYFSATLQGKLYSNTFLLGNIISMMENLCENSRKKKTHTGEGVIAIKNVKIHVVRYTG